MVQLHLPAYEGPLELLLELIESRQLDISELSLAQVAAMTPVDGALSAQQADVLAAFINVGGRLVLLKARQLAPQPETHESDKKAHEADELVALALAYKRYRDGIAQLGQRDRRQWRSYAPSSVPPIEWPLPLGMPNRITVESLARIAQTAFDRAAERLAQVEIAHDAAIERERITIPERAADLRIRLTGGQSISFRQWIADARSRLELIVSFMTVLELHKSLVVEIEQDSDYEDILISAISDAPESAWAAAAAGASLEAESILAGCW